MIYDVFLFNGEWELLEIRINELRQLAFDAPLIHLAIESTYTFSGKKKDGHTMLSLRPQPFGYTYPPLWVRRFDPELSSNPWDNEKNLRNHIATVLQDFVGKSVHDPVDSDIVIISDIDEIPRASAIKDWDGEYAALMMDKFGFWLNCREGVQNWHRARIMKYSYLKSSTPEEIRNSGFPAQIDNAGWHFSWQGGIDEVMRKFASFSHQEEGVQKHANREELIRKMSVGESLWGNDKWTPVPIDESFPAYVVEHQNDTLKHLIFHGDR